MKTHFKHTIENNFNTASCENLMKQTESEYVSGFFYKYTNIYFQISKLHLLMLHKSLLYVVSNIV